MNKSNTQTDRSRILRPGIAMTDLVVGAVLLIALIAFVSPLAVRSGRLWQDTNRTRVAMDELTNQLEILTRLDDSQRNKALAKLSVSPQVADQLPNASFAGEVVSDADGKRVVLSLQWDRVGPAKPLALVGWIEGLSADIGEAPAHTSEEEASP